MSAWLGFEDADAQQRWWKHLRESEESDAPFDPESSYVKCRRIYVDSVWSLCEDHGLTETTAHVATRYYDAVLQRERPGAELLEEFTMEELRIACVLVASKFEEHEAPTLKAIRGPSRDRDLESRRMRDAEAAVCQRLDWRLSVVTPLQCVEHLRAAGALVAESDAVRGAPLSRSPKARTFVASYARFFCNMALQAAEFQRPKPSFLASAVVMATRQLLNVQPAWPRRLQRATGHADVAALADEVLAYYRREFPDHHRSVETFAASPKSVADTGKHVRAEDRPRPRAILGEATNFFD